MKKCFFLLFLISLAFTYNAQTLSSDSVKINHTFNFYLFNGYGLSYDLINYKKSIVRLHIDINNVHNKTDSDQIYSTITEYYSSKNKDSREYNSNHFSISFSPLYVYKLYESKLGYAYLGGGPQVEYSIHTYDTETIEEDMDGNNLIYESKSISENSESLINLSGVLLVGIKAEITEHFGVFIESHLTAGRSWRKNDNDSMRKYQDGNTEKYKGETDEVGWFQNFELSRIGISISI